MNIFTTIVFTVFFTSLARLDATHLNDIRAGVLDHIGDYLTEDRTSFKKRIEKHTQGSGEYPLPGPRAGIFFSAESWLSHNKPTSLPTLCWHTLDTEITFSPDSIIKTIIENNVIVSRKPVWNVEGEDYIKLFSFSSDFSKLLVATYPSSTIAEKIPTLYLFDAQKKTPLKKMSLPFLRYLDLSSIAITVDAQNVAFTWKENHRCYLGIIPLPLDKNIIAMPPEKQLLCKEIISSDFIQDGSIIGLKGFTGYGETISYRKTGIIIKPSFQEHLHHKRVCDKKIIPT